MGLFIYFMQFIDMHLIFIKMKSSLTRKSSLFFHKEVVRCFTASWLICSRYRNIFNL